MQTITRWEPLREMEDFHNRLSISPPSLASFFAAPMDMGGEDITLADWMPHGGHHRR